jgi:CubicO group peptidase (beta-lactamase class C family)
MGLQLDSEARRYLTSNGFGHDGAGGQVAFAEPSLGLGFAYVTNLMEGLGDMRGTSVIDALRTSLAATKAAEGSAAAPNELERYAATLPNRV